MEFQKFCPKKAKTTKTIIGDKEYISPEMKKGEEYTYSTDIWSLGVLVYELCLLEHPQTHYRLNKIKYLNGEIPKLNDKDYSQELSDLIQRMLNVEPEQRPTAGEILEICESLLKKGNSGYQGDMVNGVREGNGTYSFSNGDKYEGEFENDLPNGKGKYYLRNLRYNLLLNHRILLIIFDRHFQYLLIFHPFL